MALTDNFVIYFEATCTEASEHLVQVPAFVTVR